LSVLDREQLLAKGIKIPADFDVEETGSDFKENALLKAKTYAKLTNLPVIADDSGLEVMVLDDFPGVKSNRWMEGTSKEKNLALLKLLENKGSNRKARFKTVICFFDPEKNESYFFEGKINGRIADSILGDEKVGFGYDPIFIPDYYEKTFAELGQAIKNKISHRSKSLSELSKFLKKRLG